MKNILLGVMLLILSGCTSMQTLSSYARSGDTVMVAIGGSDTHVNVPVLKLEDVIVTLTDASGVTHNVKVRNVFRVYPDPTSFISHPQWFTRDGGQSQWMAILDLVDPATDVPLPLTEGMGTLAVSSSGINEYEPVITGLSWTDGQFASIPIEIIPGIGTRNVMNNVGRFGYKDPIDYASPLPQVEIAPSRQFNSSDQVTIGGAHFVVKYDPSQFNASYRPEATTLSANKKVQIITKHTVQDENNAFIDIMLVKPEGFLPVNLVHEGVTGANKNLNVSVYWPVDGTESINDSNWQQVISLESGEYYDLAGNVITSVTPVLTKVR